MFYGDDKDDKEKDLECRMCGSGAASALYGDLVPCRTADADTGLMRIPVEVVRGIQSEEEKAMQLARIPLSCYGEAPSTVFYVEEQEGLFGMELVAHTKEVWPIETGEDMALVPEQLDDDGLPLQIVRWSVYPLEDGDLVGRAGCSPESTRSSSRN